MPIGVLMLNFGEPEQPVMEEVLPFLERIFLNNTPLERFPSEEAWRARCLDLARKRAPGLIEDYKRIGGSPLNAQARAEGEALQAELDRRDLDAHVYVAFQFMEPSIEASVRLAREDGVTALVALPVYPLCGFSTNVAAIRSVRAAAGDLPVQAVTAFHHDDAYVRYRADNLRAFCAQEDLDLRDPDTLLYFSAHGTPVKYLELGSRYDGYVEEHCARIAHLMGDVNYTLAYQNHSNRGIAWTEPSNETRLPTVVERRLVVEPISFIHEQSETLAELDIDFRSEADALGKQVFRVPTPQDHDRLAGILADLIEPALVGAPAETAGLHACRCAPGSFCPNGHREVDCHHARHQPQA
ncbi:MAG: ferrochelatase [Rhodothermales bacterium]|nr:ferrochelatase [Rhodothermales bacterium]MBO6778719.1 ferrochelatase [Rhodothermales bacterium]